MTIRSMLVVLGLVALTSASIATVGVSPASAAMRAPLWVWIAETRVTDAQCVARGGKITKHPGQGDKLFCDLPPTKR